MNTHEKVISAIVIVLLCAVVAFSTRTFLEPSREGGETGETGERSDFDASRGQSFHIGPFAMITDQTASGGAEDGCEALQPVIIAAFHELDARLKPRAAELNIADTWDTFEVNHAVLTTLCTKNVSITLIDQRGNTLVLGKIPFVRAVPAGGTSTDIGTQVTLNASFGLNGAPPPQSPDVTASVLIPDRYLDTVSTSTPLIPDYR